MTQVRAEIPDWDYWKRPIKCYDACPVHTDARGFVRGYRGGRRRRGLPDCPWSESAGPDLLPGLRRPL